MPGKSEDRDESAPHEESPDELTLATMSDDEFEAFRAGLKRFGYTRDAAQVEQRRAAVPKTDLNPPFTLPGKDC